MINTSTPSLSEFDPKVIPYQYQVIRDIRRNFDYSLGTHEILLSGSVGSAKSLLVSHIAVTHCLMYPGARFLLGRRSMPALRATIFNKTIEHIGNDYVEGKHFSINLTTATIKFKNGSEIISRSWADKKFFKLRSLELSGAGIEETTENEEMDFYNELKMRVGRLPHVKENIIIHATNPHDPSHWAYKYFIASDVPTRHVYYSVTTDNPFLPKQYIEQLKKDLDPKMARRMIYGEWIEISGEVVYYAYDRAHNFINEDYKIRDHLPIHLCFDFNIGLGKPMSCALMQFDWPKKYVFDESVIEGARTQDILEDLEARGLIDQRWTYYINGDAAGKHRDTRSFKSDYEIIMQYFQRRGIRCELRIPSANPPVRQRHNRMNAEFCNAAGERSVFVYKKAKTADEAFRLTKLKKGANYIEDDTKAYQHIGTAIGYAVHFESLLRNHVSSRVQLL